MLSVPPYLEQSHTCDGDVRDLQSNGSVEYDKTIITQAYSLQKCCAD